MRARLEVDGARRDRLVDRVRARVPDGASPPSRRAVALARRWLRSSAMVSFMTLSPEVAPRCPRPARRPAWPRRCCVPGAMAATCAARVMNVPALAARAPAGPTQTITGSGASSSVPDDVARGSSAPPGVSSWMTTAGAPSRCGLGDAVAEVAGHDLVDDAAGRQHVDARRLVLGERPAGRAAARGPRPKNSAESLPQPVRAPRPVHVLCADYRATPARSRWSSGTRTAARSRSRACRPRRRPRRWWRTRPRACRVSRMATGRPPPRRR